MDLGPHDAVTSGDQVKVDSLPICVMRAISACTDPDGSCGLGHRECAVRQCKCRRLHRSRADHFHTLPHQPRESVCRHRITGHEVTSG